MPEWVKRSLSLDQVRNIKEYVTHKAPYASRVSLGFAVGLAQLDEKFREGLDILRELDALEGLIPNSSTKEAAPLKWPPLRQFWHKHFFTSRHLIRNIGERWGLGKGRNRDLSAMIDEVAAPYPISRTYGRSESRTNCGLAGWRIVVRNRERRVIGSSSQSMRVKISTSV
jgi:hypothetical protein